MWDWQTKPSPLDMGNWLERRIRDAKYVILTQLAFSYLCNYDLISKSYTESYFLSHQNRVGVTRLTSYHLSCSERWRRLFDLYVYLSVCSHTKLTPKEIYGLNRITWDLGSSDIFLSMFVPRAGEPHGAERKPDSSMLMCSRSLHHFSVSVGWWWGLKDFVSC